MGNVFTIRLWSATSMQSRPAVRQNEWKDSNDETRCECAFSIAENEMQENIRKKARYRSHHRKKNAKHQSIFSASASLPGAQMVPFPSSSQILLSAKTFVSLGAHRFPTVRRAWAKVFCYVPFAFVASVGNSSVRESTGRKGDERAPTQVQADHVLGHVYVNCIVKSSSLCFQGD